MTSSTSPFSPFPMTIKKIPAASPTFSSRGVLIHALLQNFCRSLTRFCFVFSIKSAILTISRWPQTEPDFDQPKKKLERILTSRCNANGWRFSGTFLISLWEHGNGAPASKLLLQWASTNYFLFFFSNLCGVNGNETSSSRYAAH